MANVIDLSVVVPAYNEQDNITPLFESVREVLDSLGRTWELIVVDDASSDATFDNLKKIRSQDARLRILRLKGNFGKTLALDVGFKRSRGKIVVQLDADLQTDPQDIPVLLDKLDEGYDMVVGWRHDRKDPFEKRFFSLVYNRLCNVVLGGGFHDANCPLQAYRRECLVGLNLYSDMHRYIPYLISRRGFRVAEVKVRHFPRVHGRSKYGPWRLVMGFKDLLLVRFWPDYPPKIIGYLGARVEDNTLKIKREL